MARSSTISQPTAMRPRSVSIRRRSCSARSSTTVEATDSARPKTSPAPIVQPSIQDKPAPSAVAKPICTMAPGTAMARTDKRSLSEKCRPTPNISRMTPISASSLARPASATKPGVFGPTSTPAIRYPTRGGIRKRLARAPKTKASPRPATMVAIRGVSCGIVYGAPFETTMSDVRRPRPPLFQYGGWGGDDATRKATKSTAQVQIAFRPTKWSRAEWNVS